MKKLFLLSLASLFAIGASAISFTGNYYTEKMSVAVWKPNPQDAANYSTTVKISHEDGASSCSMSIKDFVFGELNIGDIAVDGISVSEEGLLSCAEIKAGPYVESINSDTYIQINSGYLYEDEEDGNKKKLDIQLTVYTSEETVEANKVAAVEIQGAEFVETSVEDYSGVYSSENNTTITAMGAAPTTVTAPVVVDQEEMSCSISVSDIVVAGQTIDLEFSNLELTDDAGSYSIPTSSVETTIGGQSFTITIEGEDNYFVIDGGKKYLYLELSVKLSGIGTEMAIISIESEMTSAASAQNAVSSAPVVSVKYYGINGQLFGENPVKNVMNIKVETKADGSVSSSKYIQY